LFLVLSHVQFLKPMLRLASEQRWLKAFSTCLPHLAIVSLFTSTGILVCLKPPSTSFPFLDLGLAVLYPVMPPALTPLTYSMRSNEI
ncbi:O14A2 protein, partial [Zapornia atra]|nr:O14A2 protein [Zapornia atra]